MTLTVGHISYLNSAPFFHYLRDCGFDGKIVSGVPAELNRMLAQGAIDLSPSSSFEYGRDPEAYELLPGLSISSDGPVGSVLLFSALSLDQLKMQPIEVTTDSATSVNLLKILLCEYLGGNADVCRPLSRPAEEVAAEGGTVLAIGDCALQLAHVLHGKTKIYDLGELWQRFTGLPFVFALWIVRRETVERAPVELGELYKILCTSLRRSQDDFHGLAYAIRSREDSRWIEQDALVEYWKSMSYDLSERHIAGLELFFRLSVRYGFLSNEPALNFFSSK